MLVKGRFYTGFGGCFEPGVRCSFDPVITAHHVWAGGAMTRMVWPGFMVLRTCRGSARPTRWRLRRAEPRPSKRAHVLQARSDELTLPRDRWEGCLGSGCLPSTERPLRNSSDRLGAGGRGLPSCGAGVDETLAPALLLTPAPAVAAHPRDKRRPPAPEMFGGYLSFYFNALSFAGPVSAPAVRVPGHFPRSLDHEECCRYSIMPHFLSRNRQPLPRAML